MPTYRHYEKSPGWYFVGDAGELGPYSSRDEAAERGSAETVEMIRDYGE